MSIEKDDHIIEVGEIQQNASLKSISSGNHNIDEKFKNEDHNSDHDDEYSEADIALRLAEASHNIQITPEQDRALYRKLNIYVTPLICLIYAIQYMDKVTISYTAIMGLRTDLDLKGQEFSWLGTGFYLGYLVAELPGVRILQRFPLVKALSVYVFLWGLCLTLNSLAFNFKSILIARIALGVLESTISPASQMITSQYFKKEEQIQTIGAWFSSNGLGNILGGVISYALARHQKSISIDSWKVLFIITGLLTIVLSFILYFHLGDTPADAWFLTEEEKFIALERIRANNQGYGNRKFKKYQVYEALRDVRLYVFILHGLISCIPNGGLGSFGSILINSSFKFSALESLLIGLPAGAVQIASAIILFVSIHFFGHRTLVGIATYSVGTIGGFLLAFGKSRGIQLAGYYLVNFNGIGWVTMLGLMNGGTKGSTKIAFFQGAYFVAYCVGNTIGPQTFRSKDAPNYAPAKITVAACNVISISLVLLLYLINNWENKRRDKEQEKLGDEYWNAPKNYEFLDLTDFENKNFRYNL